MLDASCSTFPARRPVRRRRANHRPESAALRLLRLCPRRQPPSVPDCAAWAAKSSAPRCFWKPWHLTKAADGRVGLAGASSRANDVSRCLLPWASARLRALSVGSGHRLGALAPAGLWISVLRIPPRINPPEPASSVAPVGGSALSSTTRRCGVGVHGRGHLDIAAAARQSARVTPDWASSQPCSDLPCVKLAGAPCAQTAQLPSHRRLGRNIGAFWLFSFQHRVLERRIRPPRPLKHKPTVAVVHDSEECDWSTSVRQHPRMAIRLPCCLLLRHGGTTVAHKSNGAATTTLDVLRT
jgi:hypothetical protein